MRVPISADGPSRRITNVRFWWFSGQHELAPVEGEPCDFNDRFLGKAALDARSRPTERTRLTLPLSAPKRTCGTLPIMRHLRKSEASDCSVGETDVVIQLQTC